MQRKQGRNYSTAAENSVAAFQMQNFGVSLLEEEWGLFYLRLASMIFRNYT